MNRHAGVSTLRAADVVEGLARVLKLTIALKLTSTDNVCGHSISMLPAYAVTVILQLPTVI